MIGKKKLTLIFISSLTKFAQLGMDKRSAGMIFMIDDQQKLEINDSDTDLNNIKEYFSFFMQNKENLVRSYIKKINENVKFVYDEVIKQKNNLELSSLERFTIKLNSDNKSCYVALNTCGIMMEAANSCEERVLKFENSKKIEDFTNAVVKELIIPICDELGFKITERMSIGFAQTSINVIGSSIRITIGLENKELLKKFAEVINYVFFVFGLDYVCRYKKIDGKKESSKKFCLLLLNQIKLRKKFFSDVKNKFLSLEKKKEYSFIHINSNIERKWKCNNGELICDTISEIIYEKKNKSMNINNRKFQKYLKFLASYLSYVKFENNNEILEIKNGKYVVKFNFQIIFGSFFRIEKKLNDRLILDISNCDSKQLCIEINDKIRSFYVKKGPYNNYKEKEDLNYEICLKKSGTEFPISNYYSTDLKKVLLNGKNGSYSNYFKFNSHYHGFLTKDSIFTAKILQQEQKVILTPIYFEIHNNEIGITIIILPQNYNQDYYVFDIDVWGKKNCVLSNIYRFLTAYFLFGETQIRMNKNYFNYSKTKFQNYIILNNTKNASTDQIDFQHFVKNKMHNLDFKKYGEKLEIDGIIDRVDYKIILDPKSKIN